MTPLRTGLRCIGARRGQGTRHRRTGIRYPPALDTASSKADAKRQAHRAIAYLNVFKIKDFSRQGGAWDSDIRTPTRLGEATITLRLARWTNDMLTRNQGPTEDERLRKKFAVGRATP